MAAFRTTNPAASTAHMQTKESRRVRAEREKECFIVQSLPSVPIDSCALSGMTKSTANVSPPLMVTRRRKKPAERCHATSSYVPGEMLGNEKLPSGAGRVQKAVGSTRIEAL